MPTPQRKAKLAKTGDEGPHDDVVWIRRSVPIRTIGFDLRRTDRAVEADLQERLVPHGLQIGMWYYMRALWYEDGLSQSEISRRVGASEPTTLDQLRRMEARGLVRRARDAADKRRLAVYLTPEGIRLKEKLLPLAEKNHALALQGFTDQEATALTKALHRIRTNVLRKVKTPRVKK